MRKTERRFPAGFQAGDLGEAVVASDGRCALISFATAPVVIARDNTYVLFVTDLGLASAAQSFRWATFQENDEAPHLNTTERAEMRFKPSLTGKLSVTVEAMDAGNTPQATLSIEQEVVLPSEELESIVTDAQNEPGASATDPDVLREIVNDYFRYYQQVTLQTPEPGDGFKRLLLSMMSDGANRYTMKERRELLDLLATALNEQPEKLAHLAAKGVGICNIRLALLAMVLPRAPGDSRAILPWQELPEPTHQHAAADEQLRRDLAALSEDTLTDLFNLVRFPKSNITCCGRILEALRDHYFKGTSFDSALTGLSGTRAHWIVRHFQEGPITRV